jgi:hypothetical protein
MNYTTVNATELILAIESEIQATVGAINGLWLFVCAFLVFCTSVWHRS